MLTRTAAHATLGDMKRSVLAATVLVLAAGCGSASGGSGSGTGGSPAHDCAVDAAEPVVALQCAVDKAHTEKPNVERTGPGFFVVAFNVSDNLSRGMIRGGIAVNTFDMLKQIDKLPIRIKTIVFEGKSKVVDRYGAESTAVVYKAVFSGVTLRRIQYDNINTASFGTVKDLADEPVYLLPDMAK